MIVLIDLFGTLIEQESDDRAHELLARRIAEQHGFAEAWPTLLQLYREALTLCGDSNRAVYESYIKFVEMNGLEKIFTLEELTWLHIWSHITSSRLYSDSRPFLERASSRHRVALVSDTIDEIARGIARYHGIHRHLHAIVATHSYGLSKPDPRIVDIALELLEARAGEGIVVIGDSTRDYELAKNVGARFIAVARDEKAREKFASLEVEIVSSLSEIFL